MDLKTKKLNKVRIGGGVSYEGVYMFTSPFPFPFSPSVLSSFPSFPPSLPPSRLSFQLKSKLKAASAEIADYREEQVRVREELALTVQELQKGLKLR